MSEEQMRAGDAERQAVADRLKAALDEGRLELHEYDERLQRAYAAKTYGDLDALTTDLPGTVPAQHAQMVPQPPQAAEETGAGAGPEAGEMRRPGGPPWLASYGGVVLVCVIVWALSSMASGQWIYFWPGWMLIPLVFGVIRRMTGRDR
ncbi:DUF1707 domain-containing protein [Couchioplanes caeruleus]|uniref:DUF1707 SHOCT-like domain-containing protein n=1 Tax=Couchioplanes caeruleus TaxID=56438 RepID=UPI0020C023B5|nr:DUF1707 domain-containing protein [Couchioplanes caeruleus]UQU64152.1 DUF1707 domain-containing protein [Couchioplanes caeruleus]